MTEAKENYVCRYRGTCVNPDCEAAHKCLNQVPTSVFNHDLYKTGDEGAPDVIKDRNGEVVLGLCKKCGRAEIELDEPCEPRSEPERIEAPAIPVGLIMGLASNFPPNPDKLLYDKLRRVLAQHASRTVAWEQWATMLHLLASSLHHGSKQLPPEHGRAFHEGAPAAVAVYLGRAMLQYAQRDIEADKKKTP